MFDCKSAGALVVLAVALSLQGCGSGGASQSTPPNNTPAPVSSFCFSPAAPASAQNVTFTDTSTGSPTSWSWTFGDGSTSSSQSPTHAYAAAGTFTVILTATNSGGSSTASHSVTVTAAASAPTAHFSYGSLVPVNGQSISFSDTSTGIPTIWSWNFGDVSTSASQNPAHAYSTAGPYTAVLSASNSAGSSNESQLVTVLPAAAVNALNGSIVLGSPEDTSIKLSIMTPDQNGSVSVQYGTASGVYSGHTASSNISASVPLTIKLTGLTANTQYYYRVVFQSSGGGASTNTSEYRFHTARPTGSTFTFTVQADSHLDNNSDFPTYLLTLSNLLSDAADFHIDLGDTFMCEKNSAPLVATSTQSSNQATVNARYNYDRNNYKIISASTPLFLANGNHEGESGWINDGTQNNLAVWTTHARLQYFLNPVPDSFYSGDPTVDPVVGQRASAYAWQWGDALFVVLDPFWYTKSNPGGAGGWGLTLGKAQFDWLEQTLATSNATFKFIFLHNLVGGQQSQMRGGAEAAPFYEWGGENADTTWGFTQNRPGWSMPIHQLLIKYKVTAVFHGHDHLYAHQSLDGIVYQEVPQPSASNEQSGANLAASYGYISGTIQSSSGYMRITVAPKTATFQYVRTWLPSQVNATQKNGEIDDSYTITAP